MKQPATRADIERLKADLVFNLGAIVIGSACLSAIILALLIVAT